MDSAEPAFIQFKLRITPELKQRIEAAAAASGRSINRECVSRLESSLDRDGGSSVSANAAVLKSIASILASASAAADPDWTEDRVAWELVRSAVDHLLEGWEPWAEEEPELSADALRAFQQWKAATGAEGKSPAEVNADLRELELREKVIGLTTEEEERLATLKALKSADFNFGGLPPADQKSLKHKIKAEQVRADFWRRVAPLFAGPPGSEKYRPRSRHKW